MIDHLSIKVRDYETMAAYYVKVLATLGYETGVVYPGGTQLVVPGEPGDVWVSPAPEGTEPPAMHVAFLAKNEDEVKAFYEAALAAGGTDNGAPGPRDYAPGYYACFVHDPEGNNIEAVIHNHEG